MTTVRADARDQQARWDDWSIVGARSDRRQRAYARIVVAIAFAAVGANLVVQLLRLRP
jgi:hypothetical protein